MTEGTDGVTAPVSLADRIRRLPPRQETQERPHADELEAAIGQKVNGVIAEADALNSRTLDTLYAELEKARKICNLTSRKANLAMKAHIETTIAVRKQAEATRAVVETLTEGHKRLIDALTKTEL